MDQHRWKTRQQVAQAVFEWIECCYNPHPSLVVLLDVSPADYEAAHAAVIVEAAA